MLTSYFKDPYELPMGVKSHEDQQPDGDLELKKWRSIKIGLSDFSLKVVSTVFSYLDLPFFEKLYSVNELYGESYGFGWQSKMINAAYIANAANLALFTQRLESEPEVEVPGFDAREFTAACEELV